MIFSHSGSNFHQQLGENSKIVASKSTSMVPSYFSSNFTHEKSTFIIFENVENDEKCMESEGGGDFCAKFQTFSISFVLKLGGVYEISELS